MLKKAKHLFLIIPIIACLFTISNFNPVSANGLSTKVVTNNSNSGLNALTKVKEEVGTNVVHPNEGIDQYNFYLFGCFYELLIETDDSGEVTCAVTSRLCGTTLTVDYYGGQACLDD